MKLVVSLSVFLLCVEATAQSWQWSLQAGGSGRDIGTVAFVDGVGNSYVFGRYAEDIGFTSYSNMYFGSDTLLGSEDAYIAKIDNAGNTSWVVNCISDGNFYINTLYVDTVEAAIYAGGNCQDAGYINDELITSSSTGLLIKLNMNGGLIWTNDTPPHIDHLSRSSDGSFYIFGPTANIVVQGEPLPQGHYIGKCDSDGELLWARSISAYTDFSQPYLRIYDSKIVDGALIGTGTFNLPDMNDTLMIDTIAVTGKEGSGRALLRFDMATGAPLWARTFGHPATGGWREETMDIDENGIIYMATCFRSDSIMIYQDTLFGAIDGRCFIIKHDLDGNYHGLHSFGFSDQEVQGRPLIYGMDLAPEGDIYMTGVFHGPLDLDGHTITNDGSTGYFISRHDTSGVCRAISYGTGATGYSIKASASGVYLALAFVYPDAYTEINGSTIEMGDTTYTTHGSTDMIFAKHDLITLVPSFKSTNNDRLLIYANPNRGSFRIALPDALANEAKLTMRIYDGMGRQLKEEPLNLEEEHPRVQLLDVAPGFYMVTLTSGRHSYSGNLVVE